MAEHRRESAVFSLHSTNSLDQQTDSIDPRKLNHSQSVSVHLAASQGTAHKPEVSPLHRFGVAKNKATDLFKRLSIHLSSTHDLFLKPSSQDACSELKTWKEQAVAICDMIGRDAMKVAFFGRTSNGKSTVINAMLHQSILPAGIGHTTNCFCSVQGSDSPDAPYLLMPDSDERRNVEVNVGRAWALSVCRIVCLPFVVCPVCLVKISRTLWSPRLSRSNWDSEARYPVSLSRRSNSWLTHYIKAVPSKT